MLADFANFENTLTALTKQNGESNENEKCDEKRQALQRIYLKFCHLKWFLVVQFS